MTDLPLVQPLEGTTSVDEKLFFEPERLSYQAAASLAAEVRRAIVDAVKDKDVIIAGTALLVDLANIRAVEESLAVLEKDYSSLAGVWRPAPAVPVMKTGLALNAFAVLPAASAVISGALGILSFFREDVDYRGIRTVVDPLAFELALAGELASAGAAKGVYVAELFAPTGGASNLVERLDLTHQARIRVWQLAAPRIAELARLDGELDAASREGNQERVDRLVSKIAKIRRILDPLTEPLSRLDRRLDELEAGLNRTDDKTGLTTLARLLRAEAIREAAAPGAVFVHAAVVSSGGHHRISRHLLRMIFLGDGLSFTGGAVIRWAVVERSGNVVKAGIKSLSLAARSPYSGL